MTEINRLEPQKGPQENFLATSADIAIYGGAAGSGKSYALLLEPLRHVNNPKFRSIIFRRTTTQIRCPGGLWDESMQMYSLLGAEPKETPMQWHFKSGAQLKFAHIEYEKNVYDWQGSQIPFIGFDELCHFSENQFFYMSSRNRSMSGVSGYIRATCNADADSWVRDFILWFINEETGFPIAERCGRLRWFIRVENELIWGNSKKELTTQYDGKKYPPKSLTFIAANIYDNKKLLEKDPTYLATLKALPLVDRERLLKGNWNIRESAGKLFNQEWFETVDVAPASNSIIRFWDRAATESNKHSPDWTVGLKVARASSGIFYVLDMVRFQASAHKVEERIKNIALIDGRSVTIGIFQDPGGAGKGEAEYMVRQLLGYKVSTNKISVNKVTASKPASSQAEAGNIKLVRATWNKTFLEELQSFPVGDKDDIVDTLSASIEFFFQKAIGSFGNSGSVLTKSRDKGDTLNRIRKRIKVTPY